MTKSNSVPLSVREEHLQLCQKLRQLDFEYYVNDAPSVEDAVYDSLRRSLLKLEEKHPGLVTPNSPSQLVGYLGVNQFQKRPHAFPMLSLENSFGPEDMLAWIQSLPPITPADLIAEVKLDGLSLSLVYVGGILTYALTRGNGLVGEDVTINALHITGVRPQIKSIDPDEVVTVRGEVVVRSKVYDKVQAQRQKDGLELFANKRNYAAGALRQKDPKVTRDRQLNFIAYSYDSTSEDMPSWRIGRKVLKQLGFEVSLEVKPVKNLADWGDYLAKLEDVRNQVDYDIDGIVFKLDNMTLRTELGNRTRSPKWAIAHKFPASSEATKLQDVVWQVGRTGELTPVAEVMPVVIHGVTVTRANLHGLSQFLRWDLYQGDTLVVRRAGDVIPDVETVVTDLRAKDAIPMKRPDNCPCCGYALEEVKGPPPEYALHLVCKNSVDCAEQAIQTLAYIASRDVFNIMGVGESKVKQFHAAGIRSLLDLFHASPQAISDAIEGRNAANIIEAVQKAKTQPLDRVIMALCIPDVGETTAVNLAQHFGTYPAFLDLTLNELLLVPDIGPLTAASILEARLENLELWCRMADYIKIVDPTPKVQGKLTGYRVVVSGVKFGRWTRKGAEGVVVAHGAKLADQVSSNVLFCVFGTKCSPGKVTKAKALSIPYLQYDENGLVEAVGITEDEAFNLPSTT